MHPYTVLQIICTGFFFPPSFHFFHILLSYINTPQTHNLPSPGPVLHFHHPHKFSGKPELESNLSKLFWHTTKPKAMSCHATWTQQPLSFVHWFCSLQLSGAFRTKNFPATLTAQNELRETFPVKLESLCSCMFLSGGCSLCEETFPGLKTEVKDSV